MRFIPLMKRRLFYKCKYTKEDSKRVLCTATRYRAFFFYNLVVEKFMKLW